MKTLMPMVAFIFVGMAMQEIGVTHPAHYMLAGYVIGAIHGLTAN